MASITTILGTDSVSSSRIVLNNNFNAINTQLGEFAALLDTTAQTLSLTGEVKGGALRINNTTIDTFVVDATSITASVEATFEAKVTLEKALIQNIAGNNTPVTTLPATGDYNAATYIMDATVFTATVTLNNAEAGQEITFISEGGTISFDAASFNTATVVSLNNGGTITCKFDGTIFHIISAMNATVTY